MKHAIEPCRLCDGDGQISVPTARPTRSNASPDGLEYDETLEECPACNGLGIHLPQSAQEAGVSAAN